MHFKKFSFVALSGSKITLLPSGFLIGRLAAGLYLQIFLVSLQKTPSLGDILDNKLTKIFDLCFAETFLR